MINCKSNRYTSILKFGTKIKTCEMHTCGEPIRIIESVSPKLLFEKGSTIIEKQKYFSKNYDHIRKMIILEPRGHKDMYGTLLTDPDNKKDSDFGILFLNNEGYGSMCGHATIGISRYLLEKNIISPIIPETLILLDAPCGQLKVWVEFDGEKVGKSRFHSVPSFVQHFDYEVFVPELKKNVMCDISFGGNFYAVVSDKSINLDFTTNFPDEFVRAASYLKQALVKTLKLCHPVNKDVEYLYGVIVTDGNETNNKTKILCVFGLNAYDRSPCGSGTTALIAIQYFKKNMLLGQKKITENAFLGEMSQFIGSPFQEVTLNGNDGDIISVIVEISGRANFTGEYIMTYEEDDNFKFGFNV